MDQLAKLKKYSSIPISGIYFIFDYDNQLIYIGKSINVHARIISHEIKKESINYYNIIEIKECHLDEMEKYYIHKYNPKYNKHHNHKIKHPKIKEIIEKRGRKMTWVADQLNIKYSTLMSYINEFRTMPTEVNNAIIDLINK